MEPLALATRDGGEWSLIHRCTRCGVVRANRTGGDDSPLQLVSLALRPLTRAPFPLERLPDMVEPSKARTFHDD